MNDINYFLVTVKYFTPNKNKYIKEQILVQGVSLTDSETSVVSYLESKGDIINYNVLSSVSKNYVSIIKVADSIENSCYYEVEIEYDVITTVHNEDKIKHKTVKYIILQKNIQNVIDMVNNLTSDWNEDNRIKSIKRTNIVEDITT